jgi:hypothetical protein
MRLRTSRAPSNEALPPGLDDGGESIHIRLSGFPAFTPFDWSVAVLGGVETGLGPVHDTTDADGNAEPNRFGGLVHHGEMWAVTVVWSEGTLTQSAL